MSEMSIGISLAKGKASTHPKLKFQTHHRARMFTITFISDLTAFFLSTSLVNIFVHLILRFDSIAVGPIEHILLVTICFSLFMISQLYPGIGLNPAMEMKTVIQLTGISSLIVFSFLVIRTPFWSPEKLVLLLIGGLSILTVLGMRWLVRILAAHMGVWGEPVAIVASGEKLDNIINYFNERRRFGFVPMLAVTIDSGFSSAAKMLAVDDLLDVSDSYFTQQGINTVLVSTQIASDLSKSGVNRLLLRKFRRLIFISDMDWLEGSSISYHDFEGMLGMEAQQKFLTLPDKLFKRMMDIVISIMLGVLCSPVVLLTALMIKLDSPGQVFYKQERVGKDGRKITILKFRSMQVNAEKILADYLSAHPQAQQEWSETQKLRDDPRITRVGKWLRKFSVDELPQLFNVWKGDMSLVGPRPIVEAEIRHYRDYFNVYSTVRPGVTGMWQVSGRSRTTYEQRVLYDVYYVRNWSLWLDLYILIRTIWVVLSRDGAY
jgi:Undecaprenyl-phosphate galactose phosphotransferase WbaP